MSELLAERVDEVLVLTLNRPEKANALNEAIYRGLMQHLQAASEDAGVRAVLLAAAGDKAFSAGADLKQFGELPPGEAVRKRRALLMGTVDMLIDFRKPLVAALQAQALGAGVMIAALADEVIAAEGAKLGMPEMKHGMPSPLGIALLTARMGEQAAVRFVQLGEPLGAAQALQAGLVDAVVAAAALQESSLQRARALGALQPHAFAINKEFAAERQHEAVESARRFIDAA